MVVVGEATDYAIRNRRRTLMAQDVLWALRELGALAFGCDSSLSHWCACLPS